jgi:hypothetical protein
VAVIDLMRVDDYRGEMEGMNLEGTGGREGWGRKVGEKGKGKW